jgi:hypothetical protein
MPSNSLWIAFDVMVQLVLAAVTVHRTLAVKLLEALLVCAPTAITPDALALIVERRAIAIEAIACHESSGGIMHGCTRMEHVKHSPDAASNGPSAPKPQGLPFFLYRFGGHWPDSPEHTSGRSHSL